MQENAIKLKLLATWTPVITGLAERRMKRKRSTGKIAQIVATSKKVILSALSTTEIIDPDAGLEMMPAINAR